MKRGKYFEDSSWKDLGLVYINVLVGGFKYERERGEYAAISSRLIAADKNGSVNKFFIEVRVPTSNLLLK